MHVLIVHNSKIPVLKYGGTERVIWYLGKELVKLKHEVTYLVPKGSTCSFANVIEREEDLTMLDQIPSGIDVVHFHFQSEEIKTINIPYVVTVHGNRSHFQPFDFNSIFVSNNHASRYGSDSFVYNGLDWNDYGAPDLNCNRSYFHFLGNAAWKVKNLKGAISTIKKTKQEELKVLGGKRFNFKMGMRFTFSSRVSFEGMVGGVEKNALINKSKGLVFPVRWEEPFGLAIIESLYFGCPIFGTPYGSLTELVTKEVGFLSNDSKELANAIENSNRFSREECHEYAKSKFNARVMALSYLEKYNLVLEGKKLNKTEPILKVQPEKLLSWKN